MSGIEFRTSGLREDEAFLQCGMKLRIYGSTPVEITLKIIEHL
jgi:hypothetical protein